MSRTLALTLPTLVVAAMLAGCGQGALTASQLAATGATTAEMRGGGPGGMHGGRGGMHGGRGGMHGGRGGMMAHLQVSDLTDEQQAQIEAIQAKYRPAAPEAGASARPVNQVAELLKAETLDVEALEAALAARPEPPARPDHTAMLTEIRAVLTDAQRAEIVAKIEARPAPTALDAPTDRPAPPSVDERVAHVATKLGLTEEQQAALVAFETALEANRPAKDGARPDFAAHRAAELAFWRTGDASQLTALKPADVARPAFPVDQFVALAQVLTAEQRGQLLARGPMGGHGGGFGKGGGPFGKGGPGGFGPGGFGKGR